MRFVSANVLRLSHLFTEPSGSLDLSTYPHRNGMLGLSQRGFALNDYERHLVRF